MNLLAGAHSFKLKLGLLNNLAIGRISLFFFGSIVGRLTRLALIGQVGVFHLELDLIAHGFLVKLAQILAVLFSLSVQAMSVDHGMVLVVIGLDLVDADDQVV